MRTDREEYPDNDLTRPLARGFRGAASSGNALATQAALRVLRAGGNAVDGGVAAGICLNVVHPDKTAFGGIAPIVIGAPDGTRHSIAGVGWWPAATTFEGVHAADALGPAAAFARCVVPAAVSAWCTALERFGTWSFERVVADALHYASNGAPVNAYLAYGAARAAEMPGMWKSTLDRYAPGGTPLIAGTRLRQHELARSLERMIAAERASGGDRAQGIRAARDAVYRGDAAEQLVAAIRAGGGVMDLDDLQEFETEVESAVEHSAFGVSVATCGLWSQGVVLLQALGILERLNLERHPIGSDTWYHLVAAALELAFADRDAAYGDPRHIQVRPSDLLDSAYLDRRAALVGKGAFGVPPAAGAGWSAMSTDTSPGVEATADTSYVAVADAEGWVFSATPSDTVMDTAFAPIVPELGYGPSGRGNQSRRDPNHPAALGPRRRPRISPMPAIITWPDGRSMALGTPGADAQPQAMLQVLLALVLGGADPQTAVELPRVTTANHFASFSPFGVDPGRLWIDPEVDDQVAAALGLRGYRVERSRARSGSVCLAGRPTAVESLAAAADPRLEALALAL